MMTSTRPFSTSLLSLSLILAVALNGGVVYSQTLNRGNQKHPIIDSQMTEKEAFDGLDSKCPEGIRKRQRLITVKYYSMDKQVHQGQLVIDKELVSDIKQVFALVLKERFPIYSVIPISDKRFRKENRWDDELSMEANNSSAFNYREKTGGGQLSNHAYGRAVDINTFQEPNLRFSLTSLTSASYFFNGFSKCW